MGSAELLFNVGSNKLVSFAVDVDNFNILVVFKVLAQFGDIHIH